MNIKRLNKLAEKPALYAKGTSVMWTDPHISQQLLKLHLNPDLDIASRSKDKIEKLTDWILARSNKSGMKILDLGCGPGLYAELFAQKGHSVTGIDFSENSIRYASVQAKEKHLDIEYVKKNYLEITFENQFDLVIMIYMDFCVLLPDERDIVLKNIHRALKAGGIFICDVVNEKNIDKKILSPSWELQESGFWKNEPYMALSKGYHYPESKVFANHHIVIDEHDTVQTYVFWNHYYEVKDLVQILESKGFADIKHYEKVLPESDDSWNGENVTFYESRKIGF